MFKSLDFSHERNLEIDELIRRVETYFPEADFDLLRSAFDFAAEVHKGQKRLSGENYIIHPLNVSATLVKLRMDLESIVAGLLHDVVEDCNVSPEDLEKRFGKEITNLVISLTKISKIKFRTQEESQAENFRNMVVAMAKDIRVIIIKLADRMHNMRTLQHIPVERQKKIARETLEIYVPLAGRLGINSVKLGLENLCLRFLHPDIYYRLSEKMELTRVAKDSYIKETFEVIQEKLMEFGLKAEMKGRLKHLYSIYKKMQMRGIDFDQVQDILAFRIITGNITECYKTLGTIHSSFTPIPGRFKDYIAIPKVNGYQSLHTTVIGPKAERIEIQIRTQEMDEVAETGVAAHWRYKEGIHSGKAKLDWIEQLLEFNKDVESNSEFMKMIKNDLYTGEIFVFTPMGDIRELCYGATPLDFAYSVHTEIGNKTVGAKVNGRMVPLRYTLKSGDTVEILTSENQTPSKNWLNIVKSSRASTRIKQWLQKTERDKNRELGHEILEKTLHLYQTNNAHTKKKERLENLWRNLNLSSYNDLLIQIGAGKITPKDIIKNASFLRSEEEDAGEKLKEVDAYSKYLNQTASKKAHKDNAVIVDGHIDVSVKMAKCCSPIPGDPIVGYVTRGRGVTVHTTLCNKIDQGNTSRVIQVEWNEEFKFKHPVSVKVITHDRPGILSQISQIINKGGINIRSASAKSLFDRKGSFIFEVEVKDYSELLKMISSIEMAEEVIAVHRI